MTKLRNQGTMKTLKPITMALFQFLQTNPRMNATVYLVSRRVGYKMFLFVSHIKRCGDLNTEEHQGNIQNVK